MRMIIAAAALTAVLGGVAEAKDMKSCAADYKTAKAGKALGGQSYMQFMGACMKGGASVSQTVTTKPANGPAVTKTTAAPTASIAGAPASATAKCKDGSYSTSAHHSGSCSHHGGVAQFLR
jgi:hypothetical protein